MGIMTTEELAKRLGLSRCTVSRVLNDSPLVSQATKERVRNAIRELGFAPNAAASSLVTKRSNVIGFLTVAESKYSGWGLEGMLNDPFTQGVVTGIYIAAHRRNYCMIPRVVLDDLGQMSSLISSSQIDAAVICIGAASKKCIREIREMIEYFRIPAVYVDRMITEGDDCILETGNFEGAFQAVTHLLELGHRRIAHLSGNLYGYAGRERLRGYCEALGAFGLDIDGGLVVRGDFSEKSGELAMERLLERQLPTAVFAANDRMALAAIKVLNSRGLRVPEDVAVVGFDDIEIASYTVPTLTTVRYPFADIGQKAVELLFDLMESGEKKITRWNKTELVVRESTIMNPQ